MRRFCSSGSRAILVAVAVVGVCWSFVGAANAGGAVWYFDRPYYEPGDVVIARVPVAWGHNDTLGTPDDGPYRAWIIPADEEVPFAASGSLADRITHARSVADVQIDLGSGEINGVRHGPNVARVEFAADVPPGLYSLLHCNTPCTKTLGDITFGYFWVGPPDPDRQPTSGHPDTRSPEQLALARAQAAASAATATSTSAPPTTTRPTTPTTGADRVAPVSSASNASSVPLVATGAAALAVGGSIAIARRRR